MKHAQQEIHELLPWYVAGALDRDEADRFREHLPDCTACREELGVVEELRDELERHGRDWIAEHPSAEQLVAVVRGEGSADRAAVERHLELCATCALEARWIRGDEPTSAREPAAAMVERSSSRSYWIPVLAAAAGLVLGLWLPWPRQAVESETQPLVPFFVAAPLRDDAAVPRVVPRPGQQEVVLHFEVDFPPSAFPLRLELQDAGGRVLHAVALEDLYQDTNLLLEVPLRIAPPGRYAVRIEAARGTAPPLVIPFDLAPAEPARP